MLKRHHDRTQTIMDETLRDPTWIETKELVPDSAWEFGHFGQHHRMSFMKSEIRADTN